LVVWRGGQDAARLVPSRNWRDVEVRVRMRLWIAIVLAVVLLAGCTGDGESKKENAARQDATTEGTAALQDVTTEKTNSARETTEETTAPEFMVGRSPMDEDEYDATVTVTRVVDGDTVDITPAVDGITRVRLIGVDTPETRDPDCGKQPYADEAKAFTTSELQGQEVGLEFDVERTDRYNRLLAYVYEDDDMFTEALLEEGYAQVATFPPNVKYVDRFLAAQEEARAAGRGLWGLSAEELAAQTDRDNGIGGGGCPEEAAEPVPQPKPRPQPKPQPTPLPQPSPQPAPQPTPQPQPVPQSQPAASPDGDVDCPDFGSSAEAQPYLLPGDPYRLDRDKDGIPCE
jgi:micrococcal nuclease